MIILTGGAGFIGSVLLKRLNDEGYTDILIVDILDSLEKNNKSKNLEGKKFLHCIDAYQFLNDLDKGLYATGIEAVFHLGASTSTTETRRDYVMNINYAYSKTLAGWCFSNNINFIYASSAATYGDGTNGFSDDRERVASYRPLNLYGLSKHLFDMWIVENNFDSRCAGFKFFNVFGPNEYHKEEMASLIYKAYHQVLE